MMIKRRTPTSSIISWQHSALYIADTIMVGYTHTGQNNLTNVLNLQCFRTNLHNTFPINTENVCLYNWPSIAGQYNRILDTFCKYRYAAVLIQLMKIALGEYWGILHEVDYP